MKKCEQCNGHGDLVDYQIGRTWKQLTACQSCNGTGYTSDKLDPITTYGNQPYPKATD